MDQVKDGTTSIFLWYPSLILNRRGGGLVDGMAGNQVIREKGAIKNVLQYSSISTGKVQCGGLGNSVLLQLSLTFLFCPKLWHERLLRNVLISFPDNAGYQTICGHLSF